MQVSKNHKTKKKIIKKNEFSNSKNYSPKTDFRNISSNIRTLLVVKQKIGDRIFKEFD